MPETKQQCSKEGKCVESAGKVMAIVFWDAEGVVLIDYLEQQSAISIAGAIEGYLHIVGWHFVLC